MYAQLVAHWYIPDVAPPEPKPPGRRRLPQTDPGLIVGHNYLLQCPLLAGRQNLPAPAIDCGGTTQSHSSDVALAKA